MYRSLDQQREEFKRARLIAMPIAGLIVWLVIGILGMLLPAGKAALALFIGTGSIAYLGISTAAAFRLKPEATRRRVFG